MDKKIIFDYDEEKNILFTEDHWELWAREDVDDFFSEYGEYFTNLGKKVYMVSNINNLLVHAKIANYYGETARNTVAQYILGFARWGSNDRARMTVRTTSLKANIPPNIYDSKEAAVEAIEKMKKEQDSDKAE